MTEVKILDKKEIELGGRRVEVQLIECDLNQTGGYRGKRLKAHFIGEKVRIDKDKILKIANRVTTTKLLTKEKLEQLKKILDDMPEEEWV